MYNCNMPKKKNIADQLKSFFSKYPTHSYLEGQTLVAAGEQPQGIYFLESGIVRQFVLSEEGDELTMHLYFPGSFFPLTWGINNEIPNFTLQAHTQTTVRIAPQRDIQKFLKNKPEVLFNLCSRLLYGMSGLTKRIEIISLKDAAARVSAMLTYFSKHMGEKIDDNTSVKIRIPFTHEEISTFTGLTRERVSIEMKKLMDKKFINYHRGSITILRPIDQTM